MVNNNKSSNINNKSNNNKSNNKSTNSSTTKPNSNVFLYILIGLLILILLFLGFQQYNNVKAPSDDSENINPPSDTSEDSVTKITVTITMKKSDWDNYIVSDLGYFKFLDTTGGNLSYSILGNSTGVFKNISYYYRKYSVSSLLSEIQFILKTTVVLEDSSPGSQLSDCYNCIDPLSPPGSHDNNLYFYPGIFVPEWWNIEKQNIEHVNYSYKFTFTTQSVKTLLKTNFDQKTVYIYQPHENPFQNPYHFTGGTSYINYHSGPSDNTSSDPIHTTKISINGNNIKGILVIESIEFANLTYNTESWTAHHNYKEFSNNPESIVIPNTTNYSFFLDEEGIFDLSFDVEISDLIYTILVEVEPEYSLQVSNDLSDTTKHITQQQNDFIQIDLAAHVSEINIVINHSSQSVPLDLISAPPGPGPAGPGPAGPAGPGPAGPGPGPGPGPAGPSDEYCPAGSPYCPSSE